MVSVAHLNLEPGSALQPEAEEHQTAREAIDTNYIVPQCPIATWTVGYTGLRDYEELPEDKWDEEFYEAHEPASRLKPLGNAV